MPRNGYLGEKSIDAARTKAEKQRINPNPNKKVYTMGQTNTYSKVEVTSANRNACVKGLLK